MKTQEHSPLSLVSSSWNCSRALPSRAACRVRVKAQVPERFDFDLFFTFVNLIGFFLLTLRLNVLSTYYMRIYKNVTLY